MPEVALPRNFFRFLWVMLAATAACAIVLRLAYYRAEQRAETTREELGHLERLVLANSHLEVVEWRPGAGRIVTRHQPTGREVLFSLRDVASNRTAVGWEDYPVESEPGWQAAAWVPVYPSAQVEFYRHKADDGTETGELRLVTPATVTALAAYYTDALRREGLWVAPPRLAEGTWSAEAYAPRRVAQVAVRLEPHERGTRILITYSGR